MRSVFYELDRDGVRIRCPPCRLWSAVFVWGVLTSYARLARMAAIESCGFLLAGGMISANQIGMLYVGDGLFPVLGMSTTFVPCNS